MTHPEWRRIIGGQGGQVTGSALGGMDNLEKDKGTRNEERGTLMMWLWLGRRSEGDEARGALRNSTQQPWSPGALGAALEG